MDGLPEEYRLSRYSGGNGAQVIELTQGVRSFKTWERLEGGKIINEVNYPSDFQRE